MHTIYTVPPYLKIRYPKLGTYYGTGAIHMFPAIRVHHRDKEGGHEDGQRALRMILEKRCPHHKLELIFENESLLEDVIYHSGGHFRDLMRLVAEILRSTEKLPVDADTVYTAIGRMQMELLPIADDDAQWLARIHETHEASLKDIEHVADLSRFFDTGVVLCYHNGPEWYDVHPLIRERVMKQVEKLKAEKLGHDKGRLQ